MGLREADRATSHAVVVSRLSKSFGGVRALRDVSLSIPRGSATAIIGENGAGKSTLMNVLAGLLPPDEGTVAIAGGLVTHFSPREALSRGVGLVPQEITLAEDRSVAENLMLGREGAMFVRPGALAGRASAALMRAGIDLPVHASARSLGMADRQMLAIARALVADVQILILDEPTASLTPRETELLVDLLQSLRKRGITILYITHRLPELFGLVDVVHVMRDGELVFTVPTHETSPAELVRAMVGRDLPHRELQATFAKDAEVRCQVSDLQGGLLKGISLQVRRGEVVGVAGLPRSGREQLLPAIFGALPTTGSVVIDGVSPRRRTIRSMIDAGVVYVPEERKSQAIFAALDVTRNITAVDLGGAVRWGVVNVGQMLRVASDRIRDFNVKGAPGVPIVALSGGNQQKVIVARWLWGAPSVVLLDDPTRGVDVAAKAEIHRRILDTAARGAAVIVASTDLPELLALSDRVLVTFEGTLVADIPSATASEESIMRAAAGLAGSLNSAAAQTSSRGITI